MYTWMDRHWVSAPILLRVSFLTPLPHPPFSFPFPLHPFPLFLPSFFSFSQLPAILIITPSITLPFTSLHLPAILIPHPLVSPSPHHHSHPHSLPPPHIVPTLKGMIVSAWVAKHFPDLVEPQFTASMEDSLDRYREGRDRGRGGIGKGRRIVEGKGREGIGMEREGGGKCEGKGS